MRVLDVLAVYAAILVMPMIVFATVSLIVKDAEQMLLGTCGDRAGGRRAT